MTDSPEPKKRGKRSSKKSDAPAAPFPNVEPLADATGEVTVNAKVDAPPPSDPTLSDRAAGVPPLEDAEDAEDAQRADGEEPAHDAETFDVPVSGFFDGEKADNENQTGNAEAAPDSNPDSDDLEPVSEGEDDDDFGSNDVEATVNLTGDQLPLPGRDDLEEPTHTVDSEELPAGPLERVRFQQAHLRGAIEALVFASDTPLKANELARRAHAPIKEVKEQLLSLKSEYTKRGIHLDEIAGGWVFRTSPEFAPFVRELTKEKPVRLTRAQLETMAILAYRQPITRPEIDDIRGVDSGPVLKLLLERDLIRILGKKEEAGRPILYGTTSQFLEFFGLKSLKDLPTLTEFTELNEDSRRVVEEELGESLETIQEQVLQKQAALDLETTALPPDEGGEPKPEVGELDSLDPSDLEDAIDPAPAEKIEGAAVPGALDLDLSSLEEEEDVPTREMDVLAESKAIADTTELPIQPRNPRDTVTNEAELTDEELYPDDKDDDFDDEDEDDDEDDEEDGDDDAEKGESDETPEK